MKFIAEMTQLISINHDTEPAVYSVYLYTQRHSNIATQLLFSSCLPLPPRILLFHASLEASVAFEIPLFRTSPCGNPESLSSFSVATVARRGNFVDPNNAFEVKSF